MTEFSNSGSYTVTLAMSDGGPDIVIKPGDSVKVDLREERFVRLRCWECGIATGEHHTWCPLWRPYEAG